MTCRLSLCPMRQSLDDVGDVPATCPRGDCPLKPQEKKAEKPEIEIVDHRKVEVWKVKL